MQYMKSLLILILIFCFLQQSVATNQLKDSNQFGRKLLPLFLLDPNYTNINHGSYGSVPTSVQSQKNNYMRECEWNPDKWVGSIVQTRLNDVRKSVSSYLGVEDSEDLVLIENASDGFNAVAKGFDWKEGDKVLRTTISYAMVQKTAEYLADKFGAIYVDVDLNSQNIQTDELIIDAFIQTVEKVKGPIKLAVIDHISSIPTLIFPIKQLTEYLHSKNISVVIDGAHVVGNIKLNVSEYGADFYFSNFHKWFYSAKTASFLWINKKYIKQTHPNIIGNNYGNGLQSEFFWTGTRDFTSYLTVADAMKFRNIFGDQEIMDYMHNLAVQVGQRVSQIWNTSLLISNPDMFGSMVNVRVPTDNIVVASSIATNMLKKDNVYMVVYQFDGKVYTRLSCQIYNELADYEFAAKKFLERLRMHQTEHQPIQTVQ